MRILFIIVLLLGSTFAFAREMEPGSEYYNLSVQLVRDITDLEFSACPDWTTVISRQEFICANFSGDARSFPNVWDASLARVINQFNLEDALEWSIGELGINKMYSISDSIMSVTLEPQNNGSQLVIYVAKPLSFDDYAAAPVTPVASAPANSTGLTNNLTSATGSNIIIQAAPSNSANQASSVMTPAVSSNPTSSFSEVTTSSVQNDYYGYPTYQAYVDAYRLKVTNPATTSQPLATAPAVSAQTGGYSNSLPAYCLTYPSRPECAVANQPNLAEQSLMPFPSNPVAQQPVQQPVQQAIQQPVQQQVTQSFNGYPSYEAYLQAFHQRYQIETQNAQMQSAQNQSAQNQNAQAQGYSTQSSQGFAGFPSYEAYLQDYNQRYGQASQASASQASASQTAVAPVVTTPVVTAPVVTAPATSSSVSSSNNSSTQTGQSSSSSQFQVSASSLTGTNTTPPVSQPTTTTTPPTTTTNTATAVAPSSQNSQDSPNSASSNSSSTASSSTASTQVLSLAPSTARATGGVLGKISTRGFRNVPWGSTPNRTKDIETWELVDEGLAQDEAYYLAYDGEVLGAKVLAVYYFSPKTKILGRGAYIFVGSNEANSQQVVRHTSLHNMLGEDYGEPNRNEKLWLNEDAKGLSDIDALETGDLLYVTQWDDNEIDVELSLFASSDELMNRVLYSSKLFAVVIDEEVN